jgi:hypothetical protein
MTANGVRRFQRAVDELPLLLKALKAAPRQRVAAHPSIPAVPGIYLFSENRRPVYVGQSRKLQTRLRQHASDRGRENDASFAFNIAKREAALAAVDIKRTRAVLQDAPDFVPHFEAARARVAAMDVQFIELADPVTRTLFEVYASVALDTAEFNSWETH